MRTPLWYQLIISAAKLVIYNSEPSDFATPSMETAYYIHRWWITPRSFQNNMKSSDSGWYLLALRAWFCKDTPNSNYSWRQNISIACVACSNIFEFGFGNTNRERNDKIVYSSIYRQTSTKSCNIYKTFNVSRLVLYLSSLSNPLKPCVKSWMEM